jgi:hypothetical protein
VPGRARSGPCARAAAEMSWAGSRAQYGRSDRRSCLPGEPPGRPDELPGQRGGRRDERQSAAGDGDRGDGRGEAATMHAPPSSQRRGTATGTRTTIDAGQGRGAGRGNRLGGPDAAVRTLGRAPASEPDPRRRSGLFAGRLGRQPAHCRHLFGLGPHGGPREPDHPGPCVTRAREPTRGLPLRDTATPSRRRSGPARWAPGPGSRCRTRR